MASRRFQEGWAWFQATGDICPLRLGMSKPEIRDILSEPDDVKSVNPCKARTPRIWMYGNLRLHFDDESLCLIHMDGDEGVVRIQYIPYRIAGERG